jgi:hypothetical protein
MISVPMPSRFSTAAVFVRSQVGCSTSYLDPDMPYSSEVKAMKTSDRRGRCLALANASATASISATPMALSAAPL